MADLKPGWRRVALGDVVDVVTEYWDRNADVPERFVAGEHIDEGDLRVRRWGMTSDELVPPTFNRRFRAGDVLFHSRNLKKLACPDFAGITGEKLFVLRSKDASRLLPPLLPFLLQTDAFNEYVNRMWAGSTNKFLNKAPLVKYEFALPPLEEQRRIGQLCAAANVALHTAVETAVAAESVRKSMLLTLYSGTPKWEPLPLGARYEIQLGKKLSHETDEDYERLPYLRNANVQWDRLELGDVATMPFNSREKTKYRLRYGDILACEGRHVGKSALWRDELPEVYFQMSLHRLRPRDVSRDDPQFMLHYLEYCSLVGIFAAATGETTIPHMSAERFAALNMRFPPRDEQREIAADIGTAIQAARMARDRIDVARRLGAAVTGAALAEG